MSYFILRVNLKSTGEDNGGQKLECAEHLESIECIQLHAGNNINCRVISIFSPLPTRVTGDSGSFERLFNILDIYLQSEEISTFKIYDFFFFLVAFLSKVGCSLLIIWGPTFNKHSVMTLPCILSALY